MEGVTAAATTPPKKPALLKGGMILCWIYAIVLLLTLAMLPLMPEMRAVEKNATSGLPGETVLRGHFVSVTTTTSQLFIIPLLFLSVVVAYGLAKDRYWSRMMMMTLLILAVVLIPPEMATPAMYAASVAVAVFGWWYLYRKANVVEYYREIRARA